MIGELILLLGGHLVLTGLPGLAAALFAARKGVLRTAVLLAILLAASGTVGILGFWTYYGGRVLGEAFSYFVLLGSVALIAWLLFDGGLDRSLLRRLGVPLSLWALGSAFLVLLGFVHGGTAEPLITSTTRFSHPLPTDSMIPLFFTEWFFHHAHHGTPPIFPGEWLASDRPPLQVGYALSQRPFPWDARGLSYEVLGVVLQQLWIIGLWALLLAARVNRLTRGLAMIVVVVSDLAIVNGFFVWPKMLPAAMLLGAAALVMTPLWKEVRHNLWAAALVGVLCGLAMLGHGSSVFGLIPLAILAAYRGLPSWRWLGVAAAALVVLMGSWSAYQKYGDPPGNRLTKWTLAGVVEIDSRGTLESIEDAYSEVGFRGAVHNKKDNFITMVGGETALVGVEAALDTGNLTEIVRALRGVNFFYLFPSLGLLLLTPIAMGIGWKRRRRNPAEWSLALGCYIVLAIGAIVWGLIVFGGPNDLTVKHICSYLLPILGFVGGVAGLRAVFPRFAVGWAALAALLSLALYAPALDPPIGTSYSIPAAVLCAAALAGYIAAVLLGGDEEPVIETSSA